MSNIQVKKNSFMQVLRNEDTQKLINTVVKERSSMFMSALVSLVSSNEMLKNCDPKSIITSALNSVSLNLSISQSLGEAYVVPYGDKAQFQIGWKGLYQLAVRSGQFKNISVIAVREDEEITKDHFDALKCYKIKRGIGKIIGYLAYFKLNNGFEKSEYMTIDEIKNHSQTFSKTYKKFKKFNIDSEVMYFKTPLKKLLTRWAPKSLELEKALETDQSVINNYEIINDKFIPTNIEYIDNPINDEKEDNNNFNNENEEYEKKLEQVKKELLKNNNVIKIKKTIKDKKDKEIVNENIIENNVINEDQISDNLIPKEEINKMKLEKITVSDFQLLKETNFEILKNYLKNNNIKAAKDLTKWDFKLINDLIKKDFEENNQLNYE